MAYTWNSGMNTPGSFVEDEADVDPMGDSGHEKTENLSQNLHNFAFDAMQSDEQRSVLNVVDKLRQCGLENVLSLPQLVVCGSQSSGKSSVLEALTEINFPRNDNLCTRFATEIIMRRAPTDSITAKVIPDLDRPSNERAEIESFRDVITDFSHLPQLIDKATSIMGISTDLSKTGRAFSKDILSIQIEGPNRIQLTVVDLPGIIQSETKGVTSMDIELVDELTEKYISQPRTICLAVIAATHDYANQPILNKIQKLGDGAERTLGIITKPDQLPKGSPSEDAFVALARNEDVNFDLGWHVLKNRNYEERFSSLDERRASESKYLRNSAFKALPESCLGIEALRERLGPLLFQHIKKELPQLKTDLEAALSRAQEQIKKLGQRRSSPQECRDYLITLSQDIHDVSKAAVSGYYDGIYFAQDAYSFSSKKPKEVVRRLRAVVEIMNTGFGEDIHRKGHKYAFRLDKKDEPNVDQNKSGDSECESRHGSSSEGDISSEDEAESNSQSQPNGPISLSKPQAFKWVEGALLRTRGRELPGNFNPLIVGELFWEMSDPWQKMALKHLEEVSHVCTKFLADILHFYCPKDVFSRIWNAHFEGAIKARFDKSAKELENLVVDLKSHPKTLNHYYTDTIKKLRLERDENVLKKALRHAPEYSQDIDVGNLIKQLTAHLDADMAHHSCEDVLDSVRSIYKVQRKTFIDNVVTQAVERHIVRDLHKIFEPFVVSRLSDEMRMGLASERPETQKQRASLQSEIEMLSEGKFSLDQVMSTIE